MQFVLLSLFDDLMAQLGVNSLLGWVIVIAIGGSVLALFFASWLKPVAKNIKPGYLIGAVILATIAITLITQVKNIFADIGG